jgi:hypothetical protein
MTRRRPSVSLDELPPEVRARVESGQQASTFVPENVGPKALVGRKRNTKRDESAIAQKRHKTGDDFEADLNMTHTQYEFLKWGKIWPNYPPFVRTKDGWQPRGSGVVDRTGHVSIIVKPNSGKFGHDDSEEWRGESFRSAHAGRRTIPIAFDAKVLNEKSGATYHHDKERQHQLHQLRDASAAGVSSFLLIYSPKVDRLFALGIENHFTDLLSGQGVKLWETRGEEFGRWSDPARTAEINPLVPSIARGAGSLLWDWIPLLQWCEPA